MEATTVQLVRERAEFRCEYCQLPQLFHGLRFHVEHVRARQHYGTDSPENVALACPECNLLKGPNLSAVDLETDQTVSLFNPRTQQWNDHFVWSGNEIVGRTAVGRATVGLLKLNGPDRLRVRELLRRSGRS
jgi:hypothetical protein